MKSQGKKQLSSKQLLEQIGFSALSDSPLCLMDEDDDMNGDLPAMLRERYHQLKEVKHTLRPGMVVTWKPGLKNRRIPAYGKPGIVVSILETPVFDEEESGSTYFREPLDIVIGIFLDSGEHRGDFLVFHTSSERYQPWYGEAL
jgi:hypothetical protein